MRRIVVGAGIAGSLLALGALSANGTTNAAPPTFVQGPGTVPNAIVDKGLAKWSFSGPTDEILLEGATTVRNLTALEPSIAAALFQQDAPHDVVYAVFIHGKYERNDRPSGEPFTTDTAMLLLDKEARVRLARFFEPGTIPPLTQAFGSMFDIPTLLPQSG